mmetsp:Transcript_9999/g.30532  ORF Transcript_9999/g.30532 Transcript_9999/m.30532 type:complete len:628 (-) Transcript_9999:131-2014(-)|eukprot:CAMPEP_0198722398 /NCGR_PEP_ID=MMETSP1475-20131203/140_1 /TAXON_ID= ORGANISM="Unidentified sp., Strain CCMP1999" /NCGR_SAMPLE_ID=MMETSP1475 /ASSEMBLY_ACC=CAM_ASM_001111 /LENGTH=627 /DNA_ID=CAMNT_0044483303 /DNA_START=179 /DNA_END=2062 /DNA_ORIENTATION=+
MRSHIRIAICGDDDVGKTSIIRSLISETFENENVPDVHPPVNIPPEVAPEPVSATIVDTSNVSNDVEVEMKKADVVVLVYDLTRPETLERAKTKWLPRMRELQLDIPVILVGNKQDLPKEPLHDSSVERTIQPIMEEFQAIEACIQCSAKVAFNVYEVLYFAQKAVIHPTTPLFDVSKHSLQPAARAALARVFRLCDKDKNGELNNKELNDFQYQCFNVHLNADELAGVKNVVRSNCPGGLTANDNLSLAGFTYLHKLFIERGKIETTWIVLRAFGYNDDLRLSEDYVSVNLTKADDQSVEISERGKEFLMASFDMADADGDGLLSPAELQELFSTCPESPWDSDGIRWTVPSEKPDHLSKEAFLDRWNMFLFDDFRSALLTIVYMGFSGEPASAVRITRPRRRDRRSKVVTREVFYCYVIGSQGSGKSELIRGLVNRPFGEDNVPTANEAVAARMIEVEKGRPYGLIMREINDRQLCDLTVSKGLLDACDMVCLVYDVTDPESFSFVAKMYEELRKARHSLPTIFVATKTEQEAVSQNYEMQPAEFTQQNNLPEPIGVSSKIKESSDLYRQLIGVGLYPHIACPGYYDEPSGSAIYTSLKIFAALAFVGTVAYGVSKAYRYYKDKA